MKKVSVFECIRIYLETIKYGNIYEIIRSQKHLNQENAVKK